MSEKTNQEQEYSADNISVMKGLEAVRKRPSMYIGDTYERGLHHLVYETVDNSIDEALAGHCSEVSVTIHVDNSITVKDDGRGIPVDIHEEEGIPAVELVMTKLHAGGKFDKGSYKVSGGLHGVGVSCVNALSEWLETRVFRDGKEYLIRFERGATVDELHEVGSTNLRGTHVSFKPDYEIFIESLEYKWDILAKRLRELAFLNPGVKIYFIDERPDDGEKKEIFEFPGGIKQFVTHLNATKAAVSEVIYFTTTKNDIEAEIALQYNDGFAENIFSYANNINTFEGGTHLVGFQTALTRTINSWMKEQPNYKNESNVTGNDVREGIAAVISIKVPEPQFEGQTKTKLGNSEVRGIVESIVNRLFGEYLEEHPKEARLIVEKALMANRARQAALKARDLTRRKNALEGFSLPGKLSDCSSKDPDISEVFIVEGDSAGGSAKQGRDSHYQAILPLRGKLINVEKARIDKVFNNEEIRSLITAVGCGIGIDEFDITKARYKKIIIMTDADVDGSHIMTLLLTFFFRQMKPLLEAGYIYVAQPPLYKVMRRKREQYIDSDRHLDSFLLELGLEGVKVKSLQDEKKEFTPKELNDLLAMIKRIRVSADSIERHGVLLESYLNNLSEVGNLPTAKIGVREDDGTYTEKFVFSLEEQEQYIAEVTERLLPSEISSTDEESEDIDTNEDVSKDESEESEGAEETVEEFDYEPSVLHPSIDIVEVTEKSVFEDVSKRLDSFSLSLSQYLTQEKSIFLIDDGKTDYQVNSLSELFETIKGFGRQGLTIQRYKGLGEMNADQLWETTMDPQKRKLLKVTMEDAVEAERMFSLLMGDVVAPRRHYIEKYASTIKDLDI